MRSTRNDHSPFIKKSLHQRLKDQELAIRNSSPQQLHKSLESCRKTLANSGFAESSETAMILKAFESKLLMRLSELSESTNEREGARVSGKPARTGTVEDERGRGAGSLGREGIVGFKRRLIQEQSFVPTSDSLLAGMSMSQSIRLQEQNLFRERELATTESLSRLHLGSSGPKAGTRGQEGSEADGQETRCEETTEAEDEEEMDLSESDRPDVERAWELAYQAGFTRGPGDMPERMLPAD